MAEFTHNNWLNETTRESPFFLLMEYNPRADWTDRPSPIPQVALCLEQFKQARKRAQELMLKAQKSWVKYKDTPKYQVGDQVWLEGRHLHTNQPTAKLAPRRHGPFKVVQVMSDVNYCLELPTQWSIHPVFHTDLLTPYCETLTHGPNYQRPPPELVEGEEEYEVEKVLDQRHFGRRRKLQYLVKWKGYPNSENQWVDSTDVFADEAIREFQNSNSASSIHKSKRKSHRNRHFLSSLLTYMTSPSPYPFLLTMTPLWTLELPIIPFPVSSGCSSSPNVVGFRPISSNTKTPQTREWKELMIKWRQEQLERA